MESFAAIRAALAAVRRRLVRQAAAGAGLYVLAVALVAAVVIPLIGGAVAPRRAPSLGGALLGVAVAALAVALIWFALTRRRWRPDEEVARHIGGSNLLSAVQLEHADTSSFSPLLLRALADDTAARLAGLDLHRVVPARRLRPAALTLAAAAAIAGVAITASPGALARGWTRVLGTEGGGRFAGARMSEVPVVGDVEITLDFPGYTGRPRLTLPASSGDFRALPGTTVYLRTRALAPAKAARLVFDDEDRAPIDLAVEGPLLSAVFTVEQPATYRFYVEPEHGPPTVEARAHSIEIEPDDAPKVELYAPAEELDVEGRKRVELAYTTEDDFGITEIALVWEGAARRGDPGRKVVLAGQSNRRAAQGKFLWDLADVSLEPGTRVAYHLEVSDNDSVLGPNVGRSRTYYLRVFSPRERHEQLMARQHELFEKLARLLGGRLVVTPDDLDAHAELNRQTRAAVVDLGGIVAGLEDSELAGQDLVETLSEMRDRLDGLQRAEAKLLESDGAGSKKMLARLATTDHKQVLELEEDVLALADWLDRQRLENILAITDEIAERRQRLAELFEEYERTGSEQVLAEIERELRALEQAMAELARQQGTVSDDVVDRFMNMEALESQQGQHCLARVRELMDAGDVEAARAQLDRCNEMFSQQAAMLEQSLAELRGDKFTEAQRKLDELSGELADLARDQRDTAREADEIMERYSQRAAELMEDKAKQTRSEARKLIEKIRKRVAKAPERGLTPFSSEEMQVFEQRLGDVEKMLDDGDLTEALAMAKQARDSLETIEAELGADLDTGEPWSDRTPDAYNQVARAVPLTHDLVDELAKAVPEPREIMSAEDRSRLRRLRRRQRAIRQRAEKLGQRAEQMAGELPGGAGEAMKQGMDGATGHMRRAEARMKASDPSGARQEARAAADALDEAQQQARGAARQQQAGGRGLRDEPVRIPGADEYRAPEEFREQILEAMKKEAPSGFAEQVQRYYEELIK